MDSGFTKVILIGGAAYVAYEMGWLSFLGLTPTAAVAAPVTTALSTTQVPATGSTLAPVTGSNSLAGIYAKIVAAAGTGQMNVDQWNTYLATAGNLTPPDPMPIFTAAISGFDRSQPLTLAQYWGIMAPALTTQLGLTGMGRVMAGLGALRDGMRYSGGR